MRTATLETLARRFAIALGAPPAAMTLVACSSSNTAPRAGDDLAALVVVAPEQPRTERPEPAETNTPEPVGTRPARQCSLDQVHVKRCTQLPPAGTGPACPGDLMATHAAGAEPLELGFVNLPNYYVNEGFELDLGLAAQVRPLAADGVSVGCCYSRCVDLGSGAAPTSPPTSSGYARPVELCVPQPAAGTAYPSSTEAGCPASVDPRLGDYVGGPAPFDPRTTAERRAAFTDARAKREQAGVAKRGPQALAHRFESAPCCYTAMRAYAIRGRALRDARGEAFSVRARRARGALTSVAALARELASARVTPEARARAAARWTRDGELEHASVAAFERVARELAAFGAPDALVRDALEAARDEARHTRACLDVATAFAGGPRGVLVPGAMPAAATAPRAIDLPAFAVETLLDGCIGETAASVAASVAASHASTLPALRLVLATIADDEARHAELAFRILAWALAEGGEPVRQALRHALTSALLPLSTAVERGTGGEAGLGHLGDAEERAIARDVLAHVVAPCLAPRLG